MRSRYAKAGGGGYQFRTHGHRKVDGTLAIQPCGFQVRFCSVPELFRAEARRQFQARLEM
ncbi:MAG: hypothetical protein NZ739_01955 [Verrucomicrobiae bacterium]|nr:hypothetical protein [Verrucomicrobiae bacterium]MCX7723248.1 hypothetical protein [Verrucomicrobiae bacterium]